MQRDKPLICYKIKNKDAVIAITYLMIAYLMIKTLSFFPCVDEYENIYTVFGRVS